MDKFEKHIKTALEGRRIAPSAKAWEKIAEQLEPEEKKENKAWFLWSAAAAAVLVFMVSTLFFQKETVNVEPNQPVVVKGKPAAAPDVDKTKTPSGIPFERPPLDLVKSLEVITEQDFNEEVVAATDNLEEPSPNPETFDSTLAEEAVLTETVIQKKVNAIVKEVMDLEGKNIQVTDAEVESLLLKAQGELLMENVVKTDGRVDAMALLMEVEDELDRTVRGQLFEKLKESYFKVRLAMAERNK
ncbi:Hypothetical protein I595_800 [Croceitalea dokdonensis DOKDO 023]|uniref:Uncharacterized protein n=1 Tax=Croceitalea dokdonensis DOKDO 023 TaxID=1300341 RepID=A0A0P7A6L0_9FLAO|nr:hypothetical protein [Croceitalea dokdonensis]KPM32384.1 Hypothetical protein I595_800 [Croceitalea dokdonensis DOKDO 023]